MVLSGVLHLCVKAFPRGEVMGGDDVSTWLVIRRVNSGNLASPACPTNSMTNPTGDHCSSRVYAQPKKKERARPSCIRVLQSSSEDIFVLVNVDSESGPRTSCTEEACVGNLSLNDFMMHISHI